MFSVILWIILIIGTVIILYFSRKSLMNLSSHGFYRFFAWESILVMIILNAKNWFTDPFSPAQVISWILLLISLGLIIESLRLLKIIGSPDESRKDSSLLGLEKTTRLVTSGLYKFIRHPMYSSLLFLAWGVFFKDPSIKGGICGAIATLCLIITAKSEEKEDIGYFGEEYKHYMKKTRMFIPYIF